MKRSSHKHTYGQLNGGQQQERQNAGDERAKMETCFFLLLSFAFYFCYCFLSFATIHHLITDRITSTRINRLFGLVVMRQ